MRPVYCLFLIISGGCFAMMWFLTCIPPRGSKSLLAQTQTMIQSDEVWKFISYVTMVLSAGMFLFSLGSVHIRRIVVE